MCRLALNRCCPFLRSIDRIQRPLKVVPALEFATQNQIFSSFLTGTACHSNHTADNLSKPPTTKFPSRIGVTKYDIGKNHDRYSCFDVAKGRCANTLRSLNINSSSIYTSLYESFSLFVSQSNLSAQLKIENGSNKQNIHQIIMTQFL